jgi:hypothetical protein
MLRRSLLQRWYRMLGAGPLIMLLALTPSLLSIDHFGAYFGWIQDSNDSPADHIGHCHLNVASCSDQPLPPNPGAAPAVVNVVEPELTLLALEDYQQRLAGQVVIPPTEPPRAAGTRIVRES